MVAVQHLDIDSRLGHPAGEQAELPGHVLLQPLDQDLSLRQHLDPGRLESPAGGGAIGKQEMGEAPPGHHPGPSALDAHARTTPRVSHEFGRDTCWDCNCDVATHDLYSDVSTLQTRS